MDPFEIQWRNSATRELRRLDRQLIPRVLEVIGQLSENPFPAGARKLQGSERTYRIRIGDYRVIYEVREETRVIIIARVRHRKDAYRQ